MDVAVSVVAGFVSILAWVGMQWRRHALLDRNLARLVAVSEVLNGSEERVEYGVARDVKINDIIRDLPPVDTERDTHVQL
jgi:hypothetical protein